LGDVRVNDEGWFICWWCLINCLGINGGEKHEREYEGVFVREKVNVREFERD
jgi:hypothetical protein